MSWWLKNNLRMIQNNLRDIDPSLIDVDRHVEELVSLGANVLQLNCGGITAFYDTRLEYQVKSPWLKDDFFGRMVKKCHENGIRVIARFDFSKLPESLEDKYPQWWVRRAGGSPVRYNDTISTCVNSEYQQFKSSEMIREVILRYRVDGVFFNFFGYINLDYSGNRFGICQCENCRRRFREMFGTDLPVDTEGDPEARARYELFKKVTVNEVLERVRKTVRSISDDVAISTYATELVDIVRSESNTDPARPLPLWPYASSENAALIQDSYTDKISSNVSINAVSFAHRYSGVDPQLTRIRLYQDMAAGAGLDFCILGGFEGYPDTRSFEAVREVFRFHRFHEECYGHFSRRAPILVIRPYDLLGFDPSCRGLIRMLKEEHLMFRLMTPDAAVRPDTQLDDHAFIFIFGGSPLPAELFERLRETKACVIGLGGPFEAGTMRELFGVTVSGSVTDTAGMYVQTLPEDIFGAMRSAGARWMSLTWQALTLRPGEGARGILPLVDRAPYGPPERAFGNRETDTPTGAVFMGKNALFGYDIAGMYYSCGYEFLRRALMAVLWSLRPVPRPVVTDAPDMVEIFFNEMSPGRYMLQLVNLTGFNGVSFLRPVRVGAFCVSLPGLAIRSVTELTPEGRIQVPSLDKLELPDVYRAFVIDTFS